MLKHIVLFKIIRPEVNLSSVTSFFNTLPRIKEVHHFNLKQNDDCILLYAEFESKEALKKYMEHEIHISVKRNTEFFIEEKQVFDFWV